MARVMVVLHEGGETAFDRDDVAAGFALEVHAGDGEERAAFLRGMIRNSALRIVDMGGTKSARFEHGNQVLGIQRDYAANRTLNRWVDGFHHAPRTFSSQIFDLQPDGSFTINWNGKKYPYQLLPAAAKH